MGKSKLLIEIFFRQFAQKIILEIALFWSKLSHCDQLHQHGEH